jgi:CheY-like chemotaxis protein
MAAIRILCVDDDPRINELNQVVLKRAGYEVEAVESPAEALDRFKSGVFDLVITDLFISGADDAAFIATLRKIDPSIPLIVASGNHYPPPEILKLADAFVAKAYSLNALTDAVREVLLKEKLRRIG